jgi:hypothetical protein
MGCLLCEFVTTELFDWMAENTTAPEVESFLDEICMKMSFPASYEVCNVLIQQVLIYIVHPFRSRFGSLEASKVDVSGRAALTSSVLLF